MDSFYIYIIALVLIVAVVITLRKVASCLIKGVLGLVVLAIAAYVYFFLVK